MCTDPPGWWCVWRREILPNDKLPQPMPLDALNLELREHYFGGGGGGNGPNDGGLGPHNDALLVTTTDGKTLLAHAHLGR